MISRKNVKDWTKTLILSIGMIFILHYWVFQISLVEGQSMEPTLQENEWLFVNKFSYLLGEPGRGDVVVVQDPFGEGDKDRLLVKRIVGMPGDRIEISGQKLYINGELVDESYTDTPIHDINYGPVQIGELHYFVMGDNRHERASLDSRMFHAVPRERIVGRADAIVWPVKQLGLL
ncbi:signal peptidase I [Paenibacillus sp. strain BS8-2]